jgi:hypothetical protein
MKFRDFLRDEYELTWRQWSLLPDARRIDIHKEWMEWPRNDGPLYDGISRYLMFGAFLLGVAYLTATVAR